MLHGRETLPSLSCSDDEDEALLDDYSEDEDGPLLSHFTTSSTTRPPSITATPSHVSPIAATDIASKVADDLESHLSSSVGQGEQQQRTHGRSAKSVAGGSTNRLEGGLTDTSVVSPPHHLATTTETVTTASASDGSSFHDVDSAGRAGTLASSMEDQTQHAPSTDGQSTYPVHSELSLAACSTTTPTRPNVVVERRNEKIGRALRLTQRECPNGGAREFQTKIEVFDLTYPECPLIFSVKHMHSGLWGRQTIVHKNLLLACLLADVQPPVDVPQESRRIFDITDQPDHLHTYLERVTPFVKYKKLPPEVTLYWWRAVGYGTAVLQNSASGKMVFFPNKEKTIRSAVETLAEVIRQVPNLSASFFDIDPYFPLDLTEEDADLLGDPDEELSPEQLRELVVDNWALNGGVGPWTTNLILQVEGARRRIINIRYSIGVDDRDPYILAIQVHKNEPLVRDLKAFPVCILQMAPRNTTKGEVRLAYRRARYFIQKLFNFHTQSEKGSAMDAPSVSSAHSARELSSGTPRALRSNRAQSVRMPPRTTGLLASTPRTGARTPPRTSLNTRRAMSQRRGLLTSANSVMSEPKELTARGVAGGDHPMVSPRRTSQTMTPSRLRGRTTEAFTKAAPSTSRNRLSSGGTRAYPLASPRTPRPTPPSLSHPRRNSGGAVSATTD